MLRLNSVFFVVFSMCLVGGCAATAQTPPTAPALSSTPHPNSIQPETTISLSATATVDRQPEVAVVNAGVETEGKTARDAMQANAEKMEGLVKALTDAGIPRNRIQTSNFNLSPRYQARDRSRDDLPQIVGYVVTNQVNAEVRDLENLGETLDALVSNGGNRLGNIRFSLIDPKDAQDEARKKAMKEVLARADMLADIAGYKVKRIVTMSENAYGGGRPTVRNAVSFEASDVSTPVLGGEVSYSATVNVTFELAPK